MESSIVTTKGQIVIEFYEKSFGILKGKGLVKALKASRRAEKSHEEAKYERRTRS